MLVGIVVLAGWAIQSAPIQTILPGLASMKANAALALVLAGAALTLSGIQNHKRWHAVVSRIAGIGTAAIGAAILIEYSMGIDLGIDELLSADGKCGSPIYPGRPAPATAAALVMLGAALYLFHSQRRWARRTAQTLGLAVLLTSALTIAGYVYGVQSLYRIAPFDSVALHTAATLVLASIGLLYAQPDFGLVAPLRSSNMGGVVARKMFPFVVATPLVLGWLRLRGQYLGYFDLEFGVALLAIANVAVLSALLWWTARSLNHIDQLQSQAQDELRRNRVEMNFEALLESAPDAMVVVNAQGLIVRVNSQTENLFGYEREEMLGQPVEILIPERFREFHPAHRASYFAHPRVRGMATGMDLSGRRKDGSEFPCEVRLSPLDTEEGVLVSSTIRDITKRKQAEQEARHRLQQEKLAEHRAELERVLRLNTMGEMAAGIAHELNQPLSAIANYARGCVRRLETECGKTAGLVDALQSIAQEAKRGSEIIRSLKRYVKKCKPQRAIVDINSVVRDAAQLVAGEARAHDVELNVVCCDALPSVNADPIQLEQVVVNLLANGIDALEQKGGPIRRMSVETRQSSVGEVEVLVADNGCGLPADFERRIFEPFFTTKVSGLGMGLAISRSMIEAHGGRLNARRNEHGGAAFCFTLPQQHEDSYVP